MIPGKFHRSSIKPSPRLPFFILVIDRGLKEKDDLLNFLDKKIYAKYDIIAQARS